MWRGGQTQLRVAEQVGEGGMGVVYRGRMDGVEEAVAITWIPAEAHFLRDQFHAEVQAQARMEHEGIVKLYDYGESAGDRDSGGTCSRREKCFRG